MLRKPQICEEVTGCCWGLENAGKAVGIRRSHSSFILLYSGVYFSFPVLFDGLCSQFKLDVKNKGIVLGSVTNLHVFAQFMANS